MQFGFSFEGAPLAFDTTTYRIASGNRIRIADIQYFVSDPVFVDRDGRRHGFSKESNRIHYVDSDLPATWKWEPDEDLDAAVYDYVEFVYGLDSAYNRSGKFLDAPESLMFWPESMGGGYHHLKINGWYAETDADTVFYPFGFHAGNVPNAVPLRDTLRIFLVDGLVRNLEFDMDVARWFKNPHVWDFGKFGGSVMQDEEAQRVIRENARDVFSIK